MPLAIGAANLWPELWAKVVQKDVLEVEQQRRACHGMLSQAEAQREVGDEWAARLYALCRRPPVAAVDPRQ